MPLIKYADSGDLLRNVVSPESHACRNVAAHRRAHAGILYGITQRAVSITVRNHIRQTANRLISMKYEIPYLPLCGFGASECTRAERISLWGFIIIKRFSVPINALIVAQRSRHFFLPSSVCFLDYYRSNYTRTIV